MVFTLPFFVLSHPWQLLLMRILQLSISTAVGIALLVACVKDCDISDVPINLAGKLSPEPNLLFVKKAERYDFVDAKPGSAQIEFWNMGMHLSIITR